MLKHCVPSALVLAQLALAGPLVPEPRDDVSSCLAASTVTTTIVEQVTVTVTDTDTYTGLWPGDPTTSQCQPPSTDIDVTSSSLRHPYFSKIKTDTAVTSSSDPVPHFSRVTTVTSDINVTTSSLPVPHFSRITTETDVTSSSDAAPHFSRITFSRISSSDIETTAGNQQPTDTAQPVIPPPSTAGQPIVEPSSVAVPFATHGPEIPPAKRGLHNMLYFGSWTIYGLEFMPETLPADKLTHVLYAFGDIASDGTVVSSDEWADIQVRFPGDSQETSGENAYGNIKQLYQHKLKNRKLKTLLSIGGWSYSQEGKFMNAAQTPEGRERFASSAVKLMADWGFDGLDVDWEYPEDKHEGELLTLLLQACRKAMDDYAAAQGQEYHYLLTIAVSASPSRYNFLNMPALEEVVDTWHLMAYDYSGTWDHTTGHAANLYASPGNPEITKANTHQAVQDYISGGVPSDKIILGLPLYGRSFMSTESRLGLPFKGYATNTSTDDGVWLYRDLPRVGASTSVHVDRDSVGAWSYDPSTKELVAFDNVETTRIKADYILDHRLGGAMFWEAAGDKTGEQSLVAAMDTKLGQVGTDETVSNNMLDYPASRFMNIRNKMSGQQ